MMDSSRSARRARRSMLLRQDERDSSPPPVQSAPRNEKVPQREDVRSKEEDVDEDDLCPICQLLLYDPVTTTCKHTMCNFCMVTWAATTLAAPVTIVDVDEEPVPFDPIADVEARCPMCRTLTSAVPDEARKSDLALKYPYTTSERQAEAESEQTGESGEGIQTMTVYIGNRHTQVPPQDGHLERNQHEWTFFVKPSRTDIVEEVHIFLHPTFRQNHIVRTRPPYQISRLGWGYFTITASVILKAGYQWVSEDAQDTPDGAAKGVLPLEWTLDFDGFGGKGKSTVHLPNLEGRGKTMSSISQC